LSYLALGIRWIASLLPTLWQIGHLTGCPVMTTEGTLCRLSDIMVAIDAIVVDSQVVLADPKF